MNRLNFIHLILFLLTGAVFASSDTDALLERVKEHRLDNGLRVVVVERHNAPVFFSLISFRVGSAHEQPDHSGLSHFLEHMLFKGTRDMGTKNYKKEIPILAELEETATQIRDIQVTLKPWRFDLFEQFTTKVKSELPEDLRKQIGSDEAAGWQAALDALPKGSEGIVAFPDEITDSPWTLKDREHNYWQLYRDLLALRVRMSDLNDRQSEFVVQNEFNNLYEVNGGNYMNAFTSYDQTTYMSGLPSNCLELWMAVESDRFQNPVFRQFYQEREVVMEELRMRSSNPGSVLHQTMLQTAFQAHPYGRPIIGWLEDIRLTLRGEMENHFRSYYAPNNCQITVVGDVDAKEVFRLADSYFGSWKPALVAGEVTVCEPEQLGERRVEVEYDAEPRLLMAFHAPVAPHPDSYALVLLDYALSSGRTSRFYRSIFEDQGLTAGSPWSGAPDGRWDDLFTIGATPKAPHTNAEVEAAILAEIERVKSEPITDWELERVRNQFRRYQVDRLGSTRWLAFELSGAYVDHGDWHSIIDDYERLMEVTPEDIQRVAKKYLTQTNRTVAYLVKPAAPTEEPTMEMGGNY